jgi:hypothetical protein
MSLAAAAAAAAVQAIPCGHAHHKTHPAHARLQTHSPDALYAIGPVDKLPEAAASADAGAHVHQSLHYMAMPSCYLLAEQQQQQVSQDR